ncbi:MAG: hypothetical protein R3E50_03845 [Halioglobus sp.]
MILLEADWQDNQVNYTSDSRQFMGALIGGGLGGTFWIHVHPMLRPGSRASLCGAEVLALYSVRGKEFTRDAGKRAA